MNSADNHLLPAPAITPKELRRTDNEVMRILAPTRDIPAKDVVRIDKPRRVAVLINTHLPAQDPRDISVRALARFTVGIDYARTLRAELGRANVMVVVVAGWPLYNRLPMAIHHVYAAIRTHKIMAAEELDAVFSFGINSATDMHGSLEWMKQHMQGLQDAYVVTSKGHANRLVSESGMHEFFERIYQVETHEPRGDTDEDRRWVLRSKSIPAHQYMVSGRASDVTRFGSLDSLAEAQRMERWARKNPKVAETYIDDIWRFLKDLEEHNVIVKVTTPGCWRIQINC